MTSYRIRIPSGLKLTDEQFEKIAMEEDIYKLEQSASGELIVLSPTGSDTSEKNSSINAQLYLWNQKNGEGKVFDSSGLFRLSNGSKKGPDASWIKIERWNQLTREQKRTFAPITPDFVIELASPSDNKPVRYKELQKKMQEYIDCGVRLGWLINPDTKIVEIYRARRDVEIKENPRSLSGEDVLVGFTLDLTEIL